jgi:tripartite-type tricarboxylate transporter receptor subunit TctC
LHLARRQLAALAAAGLLGLPVLPAQAQRVIHMVVPFGTGAVQDIVARSFSTELGAALNASVIVENRAGAGGTLGAAYVAKAAGDGNTLMMAASSHHITGHLYPKLTYSPLKDFVGVAYLSGSGYVVLASSALGVNNMAEFIREVKANPGKYNYASAGNGSATHLGMASFLSRAGLDMVHVPMKSTGDAVNEVLSGRVQAMVSSTAGVFPLRGDPRLKFLALASRSRSRVWPELPTVAESGLPGFEYEGWLGLLAPATTSKAEVKRLNAAANKVLSDPVIVDRLSRLGGDPRILSVEEFQKLLRADWITMGTLVKVSGATID